jgi:hypothetical protein
MTSSNFGFETLPTHWRACAQDVALYGAQKSIDLSENNGASGAQFRQVKTNDSPNGVAHLWRSVFKSRIDALTASKGMSSAGFPAVGVPSIIFPGRSPLLSHQVAAENYAYDRFQILDCNNLLKRTELSFTRTQSEQYTPRGRWISLIADHMYDDMYDDMYEATQKSPDQIQPPFIFDAPFQISKEAVVAKFESIHAAWSSSRTERYDDEALSLAVACLKENDGNASLWFELEEFASYCTLRESLNIVASGFYNEKWIDVGSERIERLRGTERCSPKRLMQEIANLANGRIAPLIVNEFRCISDGNHRLVAAWIWNMLHATSQCVWQTGDYHFECWLRNHLAPYTNETTKFTVWSALENLSSLLNNEESKSALLALRDHITKHQIPSLPVVPMLAYSNFALDGAAFDLDGALVRFAPTLYAELRKNANAHFPARACYHLADRVPLPWFSVLTPSPLADITPTLHEQSSTFIRQHKRA